MSDEWPSALAWELLEEFENDPIDYGYLDIETLLDAWGVTAPLPGQEDFGYRARQHPDDPHFPFRYPEKLRVHPETILFICRALRALHRRLT